MFSAATYNALRCLDCMARAALETPAESEIGLNMERAGGLVSNGNIAPGFWRARTALREALSRDGRPVAKSMVFSECTTLGAERSAALCETAKRILGAAKSAPRRAAGWRG